MIARDSRVGGHTPGSSKRSDEDVPVLDLDDTVLVGYSQTSQHDILGCLGLGPAHSGQRLQHKKDTTT